MDYNKQNRQTVKGLEYDEGKKGSHVCRHGGRCGLEREDDGRICDGRLQWKPLLNWQIWSSWGQLCRRVTCVCLWESHQEGVASVWVGRVRAEPSWNIPHTSLLGGRQLKERINWLPVWFNINQQLAGRMEPTHRLFQWKQWRGLDHTSYWWLPTPHPDGPSDRKAAH